MNCRHAVMLPPPPPSHTLRRLTESLPQHRNPSVRAAAAATNGQLSGSCVHAEDVAGIDVRERAALAVLRLRLCVVTTNNTQRKEVRARWLTKEKNRPGSRQPRPMSAA